MRILVAEDSWTDLHVLKVSLDENLTGRYDLVECRDGDQVFRFIDSLDSGSECTCPDLIIVDLHLPKGNGAEILSRIRSSPRLKNTPVAILSGSDEIDGRRLARSFEPCHYFRKAGTLAEFMGIGNALMQFASGTRPPEPHVQTAIAMSSPRT
ncbi:MAG: response regulator [Bryobacteraceae bacterium]